MTDHPVIDCEEALRRLFDYIDAELAEQPRRELEQHLDRCRSCFSRLDFERRLKSHLGDLGREPVDDGLAERVRTILDGFTC